MSCQQISFHSSSCIRDNAFWVVLALVAQHFTLAFVALLSSLVNQICS